MAVPAHDSRDYAFARHFGLEITPVVAGGDISKESYDAKEGKLINSGFLDGMEVREAIGKMFDAIEQRGLGKRLVNYRLRDAIFSRQRYWGEPFPIYYRDEIARPLPESALPLELPPVSDFGPPKMANRRWPAQRGGRRPTAIRSNCRRCPGSQVRPPTTCATWTRTTTARSSAAKRTNTGGRSTSTWAASNMRRAT